VQRKTGTNQNRIAFISDSQLLPETLCSEGLKINLQLLIWCASAISPSNARDPRSTGKGEKAPPWEGG
jgi:hypothetical protein